MAQKHKLNEGILVKFVEQFFDSLIKGTEDSVIKTVQKKNVNTEVVKKMKEISKNYDELINQLNKLKDKE
jgi:uncharacterized membrane protein